MHQAGNDMNHLLKTYIQDRRNLRIPNYQREDLGSLVRYTPYQPNAYGTICFTQLSEAELDREIESQTKYFKERALNFEWKVYDFDRPRGLRKRLREYGFEEGDKECLMIYDLKHHARAEGKKNHDFEIREISLAPDFEQVVKLQESIWNRELPWLLDQMMANKDRTTYFCAFHQNRHIGVGWIEYPEDSQFAELHGGSVSPEFRGRGVYSLLFEARVADAISKNIGYVTVDAAPMSRPILVKKGFQLLSNTYPMVKKLQI